MSLVFILLFCSLIYCMFVEFGVRVRIRIRIRMMRLKARFGEFGS